MGFIWLTGNVHVEDVYLHQDQQSPFTEEYRTSLVMTPLIFKQTLKQYRRHALFSPDWCDFIDAYIEMFKIKWDKI